MAYDKQLFTNNAVSLLATAIGPGSTTLTVLPGDGALFPSPGPGEYFLVTLEDQANTVREIVRVNGRTGDTFTGLVRGYEGTVPSSWTSGPGADTLVDHRVTAETMRLAMELPQLVAVVDPSVAVPATTTGGVATFDYGDESRAAKFWVQMYEPATGRAQAFEVYTIIQGILSTNTETVIFNRTNRIGYNFPGSVDVQLDTINKVLTLRWVNSDLTADVIVTVTRI